MKPTHDTNSFGPPPPTPWKKQKNKEVTFSDYPLTPAISRRDPNSETINQQILAVFPLYIGIWLQNNRTGRFKSHQPQWFKSLGALQHAANSNGIRSHSVHSSADSMKLALVRCFSCRGRRITHQIHEHCSSLAIGRGREVWDRGAKDESWSQTEPART